MKGGLLLNSMLLMFCILFAFRAYGFTTGIEYMLTFDFTSDAVFYTLLIGIGGAFIAAAGTSIVSRLVGGSFSVIYLIPAAALGFLASSLLAPIGFLINTGIPPYLKVFVMGIIYIMLLMGALGFVRGGEP